METPVTDRLERTEEGRLALRGVEILTGTLLEVELDGHWVSLKVDSIRPSGTYLGVLPDGRTVELREGMSAVIEPRTTLAP